MGKIELDHTGSGSGITLSSDGTSLLLDGSAVGGGADLYAANPSSATDPIASGANAVAIGSNTEATGDRSMALIDGAEAGGLRGFAVGFNATTSGNNSVAIGTSAVSSGTQAMSFGALTDATGEYSLALGYTAQAITGARATAISRAYASGTDSLAAAIASNSSSYGSSGNYSLSIGQTSKASGSNAISLGSSNTSSGVRSVTLGGEVNTASAENSYAFGVRSVSDKIGQYAFGCWIGQQGGMMVLKADTTNATPKAMASNNNAGGSTNQIILPNNSAYAFHGTIVARQKASEGTASAAWKVEGLIRREGSAGTTVLVNSATTVLDNTPSWGMALSADTTNGGLAITVTGAASTNVKFVANITTSEVTYA